MTDPDLQAIRDALETVADMGADWYDREFADALPALARVASRLERAERRCALVAWELQREHDCPVPALQSRTLRYRDLLLAGTGLELEQQAELLAGHRPALSFPEPPEQS